MFAGEAGSSNADNTHSETIALKHNFTREIPKRRHSLESRIGYVNKRTAGPNEDSTATHMRYLETAPRRFSFHGDESLDRKPLMEVLRAYYAPEGTEHEFHDDDPDENLYSDKNLLKRESMRFHPQIVQLLKKMWTIADADGSGGIDLDEYTEVFFALYNAMHVESPRSGQSEDHTEESNVDKDKIKERNKRKDRKERKERKERNERNNKSAARKQRTGNYNSTEEREKSKEGKQNKGTKEETEDTEGEATKKELLTEEEVKALAAEEFARDAFGKDELDKKTFMQCYFQLADTWTEKVRLVVCPQPCNPQPINKFLVYLPR